MKQKKEEEILEMYLKEKGFPPKWKTIIRNTSEFKFFMLKIRIRELQDAFLEETPSWLKKVTRWIIGGSSE